MRTRSIVIAGVLAVVMAITPAALAKGPLGAVIEGDGVTGQLVIDQPGELGQGTAMSELVEAAGFFELTFGDAAGVLDEAPTDTLGKQRIVITWDMADGDTIVQEVYHKAAGGPVSYVAPGQTFWEDTEQTAGGWFVTGDIAGPLIELGVAAEAFELPSVVDAKETEAEVKAPPVVDAAKGAAASSKDETGAAVAPQVQAPVTERTATSDTPIQAIVAVAAVIAIMGTALWMLRRRPILR